MPVIITGVLAGSIFAALVMHIVENKYLNGGDQARQHVPHGPALTQDPTFDR